MLTSSSVARAVTAWLGRRNAYGSSAAGLTAVRSARAPVIQRPSRMAPIGSATHKNRHLA